MSDYTKDQESSREARKPDLTTLYIIFVWPALAVWYVLLAFWWTIKHIQEIIIGYLVIFSVCFVFFFIYLLSV